MSLREFSPTPKTETDIISTIDFFLESAFNEQDDFTDERIVGSEPLANIQPAVEAYFLGRVQDTQRYIAKRMNDFTSQDTESWRAYLRYVFKIQQIPESPTYSSESVVHNPLRDKIEELQFSQEQLIYHQLGLRVARDSQRYPLAVLSVLHDLGPYPSPSLCNRHPSITRKRLKAVPSEKGTKSFDVVEFIDLFIDPLFKSEPNWEYYAELLEMVFNYWFFVFNKSLARNNQLVRTLGMSPPENVTETPREKIKRMYKHIYLNQVEFPYEKKERLDRLNKFLDNFNVGAYMARQNPEDRSKYEPPLEFIEESKNMRKTIKRGRRLVRLYHKILSELGGPEQIIKLQSIESPLRQLTQE